VNHVSCDSRVLNWYRSRVAAAAAPRPDGATDVERDVSQTDLVGPVTGRGATRLKSCDRRATPAGCITQQPDGKHVVLFVAGFTFVLGTGAGSSRLGIRAVAGMQVGDGGD